MANTLSESVMRAEPLESVVVRQSVWKRWPKWILLLLLSFWVADTGISLLIRHSRLQRKITARLESAFGRPVEVGRYDFSLWGWPTLEAQSVTVGEDPRFGHEYFLRAESLTIRIRWLSLLRGRLEFGRFSLSRPSLNLVRNSTGDWNLAEWLPRPSSPTGVAAPVGPPLPPSSPLRFTRIEVDSGRINFKRGDEKLPFAFVHVKGYLEPETPGRWRFDLQATPMRAAVIPQQAGVLHLSGHVGGTSSRLRPAAIDLSWTGASVPDILRLARNYDYGVRGTLALQLNAQTEGDNWLVQSHAELRQLHRWDLSLRADNPAVNLTAKMHWNPMIPGIQFEETKLEAPHSNARARIEISWDQRRLPSKDRVPPFAAEVRSAEIDFSDLLAWLRAFHAGVADDISLHGHAKIEGTLRDWPAKIEEGTLEINGAELNGPHLRMPVRLSPTRIQYDARGIHLQSFALKFGTDAGPYVGAIAVDGGTTEQAKRGTSNLRVAGRVTQVRDVVATASAFGWNISRGWDVAGPAGFEFLWLGSRYPWQAQPRGTLEWGGEQGGASLAAPFLNLPVERIRARVDFLRGARVVTLKAAEAFGAHWKGSFTRLSPIHDWEFALTADHFATADLDRWLNPHWRHSFLNRMLPFLNSPSPVNAVPDTLRAGGKLTVDQFTSSPFAAHHLQGEVKLAGRRIVLTNARAQFYGGEIGGSFEAELTSPPAYHLDLNFSRVDLSTLTNTTPSLANLFAGAASGQITLNARGANRADLLASLECQGTGRVQSADLRNLNLPDSARPSGAPLRASPFREASAAFTCASGKIQFQELALQAPNAEFDGSGTVDFSRNLDFRLGAFPNSAIGTHNPHVTAAPVAAYRITGPIATPQITRASARTARP